ncbi:MAG: DEAD/DEAH box helicase family protein [Cyanobacteria bacterium]|jgi:superfamily II DNA or RNA helicase|nr:DEAD/DEAH box helicase family protein [Cyanobacteria bacterium GSL.Bin1]
MLRPYQKEVIAEVYHKIRCGKYKLLVFSATGSGKTIILSKIIADARSRNRRSLILVHRDPLIQQTANKLNAFGLDCGFIKAGWAENRGALIQVASVQTLANRHWWREWDTDLIIFDECHITAFSRMAQEILATYPKAIYLGLTATPWRLSKGEEMGDVFTDLVTAPMPCELIDQGFLIKPSYYSAGQAQLEEAGTLQGEFNPKDLAFLCDRVELIEQITREWFRLGFNRRTIVFAVNVTHSQNLCSAFERQGIASRHIDGNTPISLRNEIYQELANHKISVLCSCLTLTEGFDVPSVDAILLCRPTQSKALYFQMVGRGLRLSPSTEKTDCLILDQGGNIERHGFVEDLKREDIELNPSPEKEQGKPPTKVCACGKLLYAFRLECPSCRHSFEIKQKYAIAVGLERFLTESDVERLEFYRKLLKKSFQRKIPPTWAASKFKEKYGHFPPWDWARSAVFDGQPSPKQKEIYREYIIQAAQKKNKGKHWIERYLTLEFNSD